MNRGLFLVLVLLSACDSTTPPADGGRLDARADGSSTTRCEREDDCEDGLYCTAHLCRPGETGADARGCIVDPNPICAAGEVCDETARRCQAIDCSVPDADEDGHELMGCGGDDCDDTDPNRHPGNAEVCDSEGHDEDCVPATLAGPTDGDRDGDGEVSSSCCFGDVCGGDCDDDDASVSSSAREVCNGIDDDCSGLVDDGDSSSPLCPGGTCTAGRCSFTPWDRIFGGAGNDYASAVVTDAEGNLYITGPMNTGVDFGSGPTSAPAVVSYTASGVLRWALSNDAGSSLANRDIAFDEASNRLYLLSFGSGSFGSVSFGPGPFLAALDSTGSVDWVVPVPGLNGGGFRRGSVQASAGVVVVASGFQGSFDPGDGTARSASGSTDGYILALRSSGAFEWMRTFGAVGARTALRSVSIDDAGNIYVTGDYDGTVDFGAGPQTAPGVAAIPVICLDSTGATRWARVFGSSGFDAAEALDVGPGGVFLAGQLGGPVDFGGGDVGATGEGYLAALQLDGSYRWTRTFRPVVTSSGATVLDVEAIDDGGVWVVGTFSGTVDFGGGGGLTSYVDGGISTEDIFMVLFAADRTHLRDRALGESGRQAARSIAVGPGGSTTIAGEFSGSVMFASGRRTAPGGTWGFVARTAD